jgi:hypothetical protein
MSPIEWGMLPGHNDEYFETVCQTLPFSDLMHMTVLTAACFIMDTFYNIGW